MNIVKLAIAGGGVIGRRHASAIAEATCAKLVAIADPAPNAQTLADEFEVALYNDLNELRSIISGELTSPRKC